MSEEATPVITNPEKPEKVKDPKRVEAGKKLAAISKAAKEKKARARVEKEIEEAKKLEGSSSFDWKLLVVGAIGALVVFCLHFAPLAFAYKWCNKEQEQPTPPPSPEKPRKETLINSENNLSIINGQQGNNTQVLYTCRSRCSCS